MSVLPLKMEGIYVKIMGLRGCYYDFEKMNSGKRKEIYHNYETGNTLVFVPCHKDNDRGTICDFTPDDVYQPLIRILNTRKNVVVYWSQVEGTTSDFTIYMNTKLSCDELKSFRKTVDRLDASVLEGESTLYQYKYNIVMNGFVKKFPLNQ